MYLRIPSKSRKTFATAIPFDRMVETDDSLGEHYQRLVARFVPVLSNLESGDAAQDLETIRAYLAPSSRLPHARVTALEFHGARGCYSGRFPSTSPGTKSRGFRYESLSGGGEGGLRPPIGRPTLQRQSSAPRSFA